MDQTAEMLERIADLEARLAIIQLEGAYAHLWDSVDAPGWAALFTENGVFETTRVGPFHAVRVEGREELARLCRDFNATWAGLHQLGVPDIRVSGDTAEGAIHFRFRQFPRTGDPSVRETIGLYQVHYTHVGGVWKMAHRLERAVGRDSHDDYAGFYESPCP
jgi:hypothetical protein